MMWSTWRQQENCAECCPQGKQGLIPSCDLSEASQARFLLAQGCESAQHGENWKALGSFNQKCGQLRAGSERALCVFLPSVFNFILKSPPGEWAALLPLLPSGEWRHGDTLCLAWNPNCGLGSTGGSSSWTRNWSQGVWEHPDDWNSWLYLQIGVIAFFLPSFLSALPSETAGSFEELPSDISYST